MRLCVGHVYWMLLITSVVSSALLFLIVASESIQNNKFIGPDRSETPALGENVSYVRYPKDPLETRSRQKSNVKIPSPLKRKIREQKLDDAATPVSSFDLSNKREDGKLSDEIEILKESLNQQPNLSQGISENGHQAVVLTLVDSALGFRSAPSHEPASNGSEAAAEDELARLTELIGEGNASAANHSGGAEQGDVVVVVRAEQRSIADLLARPHDELEEEEELVVSAEQLAKSPTTAPELNDSAARARLTNGADDGNAAILDSLVTAGPTEPHEEIPSFNEWAQKRLEEAEKKKTHSNASLQTGNGSAGRSVGNMRMRSKNYASPDCGAKVVAANPESRSARNVLVSTRDEYMLNTCTSRVWFVVEMCEAIQAKKIELANFELFSSSPKDLSVYVSDRFPTRDWQLVGQFTARDERDVQSFSLQPQLFGKFIKVELHSHYGSEHFCPISLFRAYGTSEFEVLETETESDAHADAQRQERGSGDDIATGIDIESEDDEDEENVFEDEEESTIEPPSHIISSARDAVLSIMKKAVGSLLKSDDLQPTNNITKIQESIRGDVLEDATLDDCTTPLYSVACRKCNDNRYARVFQLISCKGHYLESLLSTDFVMETLTKSHLCGSSSGLDVIHSQTFTDGVLDKRNSEISHYYLQAQFLSAMFTPDYIMALCNVLAAQEQRLFVNESHQEQRQQETAEPNKTEQSSQAPLLTTKDERLTPTRTSSELPGSAETTKVKADVPVIKSKADGATETLTHTENLVVQIKPTKTTRMIEEAKKQTPIVNLESSRSIRSEDTTTHQTGTPSTTETSLPVTTKRTTSSPQKVASEHIQEGSLHRDVSATTKVTQTTESSQKLGEKNVVTPEIKETETKIDDESEPTMKVEPVEQEPKAQPQQDQLNFDGFDFKDLDVESLQSNGNSRTDASVTQQTASATTPQQKESVFLRLSNRIKALERNMSLSSQYLEELSRRYKKQVEEMQRSLERAMMAMNEELRKGEERESKQQEEMNALRSQIDSLTRILDELIFERNSWSISFSSLLQHSIFITFDVVIVILILSYCRRTDDDLEYYDEEDEVDERNVVAKPKRGKNYEIVKQSCTQFAKKPKKRRPSEIASQVSGTYDQLMIEDGSLMIKRDRRKKRKKDLSSIRRSLSIKDTSSRESNHLLNVPLRESTRHSRSASASDAMYTLNNENSNSFANLESQRQGRPDSAPDNSLTYFTNQQIQQQLPQIDRRVEILSMEVINDESTKTDEEMPNSPEDLNTSSALEDDAFEREDSSPSSIRAKVKKLSSPSFMKTALGSRSKRLSFSGGSSSSNKKHSLSLDESSVKSSGRRFDSKMDSVSELELFNAAGYDSNNSQAANGHGEETDESRSSNATPTASWSKKEKKSNGLKKMVKKFF